MIIFLIINKDGMWQTLGQIFKWVALVLTIISLVDYMAKNKTVLTDGGM